MSRWHNSMGVAVVALLLGFSVYLIAQSAIDQYNNPSWPGNVLSVLFCVSNCATRCRQQINVDISWQVANTTYQQNNTYQEWFDQDYNFCKRLGTGGKGLLDVMTKRDAPQIALVLVPTGQDYFGESLFTGVFLLSVLIVALVCTAICICTERRKGYNQIEVY